MGDINAGYKAQLAREIKDAWLTVEWCNAQEMDIYQKKKEAQDLIQAKQKELHQLTAKANV